MSFLKKAFSYFFRKIRYKDWIYLTFLSFIFNFLGLKRVKLCSFNNVRKFEVLENGHQKNFSVSPNYLNTLQKKIDYRAESIELLGFEKVFGNINSASFITENQENIFIEKFPFIDDSNINYSSGFVEAHNQEFAYIKKFNEDDVYRYKNIFFLGGNGSFNFYHWMIEIAPKLLLLTNFIIKKYNIQYILVNKCVENNDNYNFILKQCLKHLNGVDLIYVEQSEVFFAEKIFYINSFNQTIYNVKKLNKDYSLSTIYNRKILELFKSRINEGDVNLNSKSYSKIFILRNENAVSQYNRRAYNEKEIFDFFKQEGFIGIYPDQLTLIEQINIFKNAKFIVGPTGASWSNIIFSKNSTKAISWLPSQLKNFDTYSTLAYFYNIDMRFIEYNNIDGDYHSNYNLNLEDIINLYYGMI